MIRNKEITTIEDAPKGFVYQKTKIISKKKVKKQNRNATILFLIGFILPTALAIYKRMSLNTDDTFEKYYLYIFIGLISLDIIIYLPIYFINKSIVRKSNHKKLFLVLLTIRKFEKLVMAIYSLTFIFYGIPKDSFHLNINGLINIIKTNALPSILSLLIAIISLLSNNKRLIKEVSSELVHNNLKLEKYEYDKASGNVIVKVYKRVGRRSIRKILASKFLSFIFSLLFSIAMFIVLTLLLKHF